MQYTNNYESPIGKIIMASDGKGLSGLWFEGQKYFGSTLSSEYQELDLPIFEQTKQWLDLYFNGSPPNFTPLLSLNASSFYLEVWKILRKIPYGQVTTYGNIAKVIAESRKIKTMSAQAVGGAVGHNPILSLIHIFHSSFRMYYKFEVRKIKSLQTFTIIICSNITTQPNRFYYISVISNLASYYQWYITFKSLCNIFATMYFP